MRKQSPRVGERQEFLGTPDVADAWGRVVSAVWGTVSACGLGGFGVVWGADLVRTLDQTRRVMSLAMVVPGCPFSSHLVPLRQAPQGSLAVVVPSGPLWSPLVPSGPRASVITR